MPAIGREDSSTGERRHLHRIPNLEPPQWRGGAQSTAHSEYQQHNRYSSQTIWHSNNAAGHPWHELTPGPQYEVVAEPTPRCPPTLISILVVDELFLTPTCTAKFRDDERQRGQSNWHGDLGPV